MSQIETDLQALDHLSERFTEAQAELQRSVRADENERLRSLEKKDILLQQAAERVEAAQLELKIARNRHQELLSSPDALQENILASSARLNKAQQKSERLAGILQNMREVAGAHSRWLSQAQQYQQDLMDAIHQTHHKGRQALEKMQLLLVASNKALDSDAGNSAAAQQVYRSSTLHKQTGPMAEHGNCQTTGVGPTLAAGLINRQGQNSLGFQNCCALSTIANMCRIAGLNVLEDDVVQTAVALGACHVHQVLAHKSGGTRDAQIATLLSHYGLDSKLLPSGSTSPDYLASCIENGHLVTIGVNAQCLWSGRPALNTVAADHQILLTNAVRDSSGRLVGFWVADTGKASQTPTKYVSVDALRYSFWDPNVGNTTAFITKKPLLKP